jgi:hypothetical protein
MQGKAHPVSDGRPMGQRHSGAFLLTLRQCLCRNAADLYGLPMRHLALCLALAACVPTAETPPPQGDDTCGSAPWQARAGQPVALFPDIPPGARVIRPGDAVTEDFSPTRLNIDLDDAGRILRAWCG